MVFVKFLFQISIILLLVGCSYNGNPKSKEIIAIDELTPKKIDQFYKKMKSNYSMKCVKPIIEQNIGDSNCSSRLFQLVERRYGLSYKPVDLNREAYTLFEPVVISKLKNLLKKEPHLKDQLKKNFDNPGQLLIALKTIHLSEDNGFYEFIKP